jgi:pimeloyl-ACP methyl ester carboxylesterase
VSTSPTTPWPPIGFTHQSGTTGEATLEYWAGGHGEPVLLIPGWPQTAYAWRYVMTDLVRTHKVVAVNPRGFGDSDAPDSAYDTSSAARDLATLMRDVASGPWHIVGHDVGMWIAYALAGDHRDLVASMVAIDAILPGISNWPSMFPPPPAIKRMWHFGFNRVPEIVEALVPGREAEFIDIQFSTKSVHRDRIGRSEIYAQPWKRRATLMGAFAYYRDLDITVEQNQRRRSEPLDIDVLAVGGNRGAATAPYGALLTVGRHVTQLIIDDCGHYVPEEQPAVLSAAIAQHIATNTRRTADHTAPTQLLATHE